jgi:hypothetical protein
MAALVCAGGDPRLYRQAATAYWQHVKLPGLDLRENSNRLTIVVMVVAALIGIGIALAALSFMES